MSTSIHMLSNHQDAFKPEDLRGWKVRPKSGGSWLFVNSLAELDDCIEHEGDDESGGWELVRVTLTEDEARNMREFDGW